MTATATDHGETCPVCKGSGEIEQAYYAGHGQVRYRYYTCGNCEGSGTLGDPLPTYLDGDYQRDARDGF